MLRDEYDHQLAPHLALNAFSSHAESLAYLPDDLGRAADFQTIGCNGKPLHDRKPFYDVSLKDFLSTILKKPHSLPHLQTKYNE